MSVSQQLVYVVDDSADYRFLVGQVFKRFLKQYRVQYYESGTALCAQLGTEPVDMPFLILMDNEMPGLTGPQTLSFLKGHPYWQKVPIIIISSNTSPEEKQRAYTLGAASYLFKPLGIEEHKEQLSSVCQYWSEAGVTADFR